MLNLGIHARDAMPDGGRLTVATTMHTHDGRDAASGVPGEYVRMVVADTGGGMSAAAQSRLFEPFFASEDAGGSAMGLAKVDAIVKQAGGRIQVDSAAGVGTTFTIDLPATSEPAAGPDRALAEARLMAPVLVVEDEPGMRELIRLVLVRAGHEVVTVAGPHAALAALNRQPAISLMLVDVVMPEMDGYDLVAEARKISPGVHVVFMSAFRARYHAASERRRLPREAVYRRVAHRHRRRSAGRCDRETRAEVVDVDRISDRRGRTVAGEPIELGAAGLLGSQLESNEVVDRHRIRGAPRLQHLFV